MAHKGKLFNLSVAFEFTTSKGNWIASSGVVLDWWRPEFGEVDTEHLKVGIQDGPAAGEIFRMGIGELSEEIFDVCANAHGEDDIADRCAGLETTLLVNILKSPADRLADAWTMRRDFLETSRTEDGVIKFLNRWGSWSSGRVEIVGKVINARSQLAAALADQPEKWLRSHASHLSMVSRTKDYPYFLVKENSCARAARTATTIDFLSGLRFRVCARQDCAIPFPVESKHRKKYCQWYCGHLESMRRNRRKAK